MIFDLVKENSRNFALAGAEEAEGFRCDIWDKELQKRDLATAFILSKAASSIKHRVRTTRRPMTAWKVLQNLIKPLLGQL